MIVCLRECARVGQAVSNDLEMLNWCMLDICVAPEFPSASGTCTNNINILLTTSRGILSPTIEFLALSLSIFSPTSCTELSNPSMSM